MESVRKPQPVPDGLSAGFWDACRERRLVAQRCLHCGHWSHPPESACSACQSTSPSFAFEALRGTGRIRTWTVMRETFLPSFSKELPYVIAIVELDEQPGLRMAGRILDGPNARFELGSAVRVSFDDGSDSGLPLPHFRLAQGVAP
jgi:uncharacterized OB-fold protein